jgi:hypothetical protein
MAASYSQVIKNHKKQNKQTRTGNRYQERRNFDITSFRHQLISSSFSSSRSNRNITSFRSDMGTDGPTEGPTNQRTDQHSLL